jgi:hypothetical protein
MVQVVDPLTVVIIDTGVVCPGILLAFTRYSPQVGDVVTTLALSSGEALVLGLFS